MLAIAKTQIRKFERLLRDHKFAVTIDNPSDLRAAFRREAELLNMAADGNHELVRLLQKYQKNACSSMKANESCEPEDGTVLTETSNSATLVINTKEHVKSDETLALASDLIRYRKRLLNMDWDFDKEPDSKRHRTGFREFGILRAVAKGRGGAFATIWKDSCQKHGFKAWKEAE